MPTNRDNYDNINNKIKYFQSYIKAILKHGLGTEYNTEIKYFRHLITCLTIEKRFPEEFAIANRSIIEALAPEPLPSITDNPMMMEGIDKLFKTIYSKDHTLRNNLFYCSNIPIVQAFITLSDIDKIKAMTARSTLSDIVRSTDLNIICKA